MDAHCRKAITNSMVNSLGSWEMWDKSDWNAASREDSVLFRVRAGGYGALFEALDD